MLNIILVAVGTIKNKNLKSEIDEYIKRINSFAKFDLVEIPAESFSSKTEIVRAREQEETKIRSVLMKRKGTPFLLDEKGKEMNSVTFNQFLSNSQLPIILVVGGTTGFSDAMKAEIPSIALSQMTFPHEIARLLVVEQIYRATTMGRKENKYHY